MAGGNVAGQGHIDHGRPVRAGEFAPDHVKPELAPGRLDPAVKFAEPAPGLVAPHYAGHEGEAGGAAAGCDVADRAAGSFPSDRAGRMGRKKMTMLDHAIGLEQEPETPRSPAHHGTIIADPRDHIRAGAAELAGQTRNDRILAAAGPGAHVK
jgi:hypothetical protein